MTIEYVTAQWITGGDTGISSRTIWGVMNGAPPVGRNANVPLDPSDFGRCYRLLALIPEWKRRLPEMAIVFPRWTPMVREWPRLQRMYTRALRRQQKTAPVMYELMRQCVREGILLEGGTVTE